MIDQAHVDQCQRFLHARSDQLVGLARLLDARWVIVIRDACCRTLLQRELHDLTRVHRGSSIVPRKRSTHSMTLCLLSSRITPKTSWSRWPKRAVRYSLAFCGDCSEAPRRTRCASTCRAAMRIVSLDAGTTAPSALKVNRL